MTKLLSHLAGQPVIVGSGIAGLVAALTLAPRPVVLVTRAELGTESSSAWAQGGIAASLGPDDSVELHLADTLAAGDGLCDPQVAASILADSHHAIAALERFGVRFDRNADGSFALGLEAAHCRRRIAHVQGDGAGAAIVDALVKKVLNTPSITVLRGCEAQRLVLENGAVCGLLCATSDGAVLLSTSQVLLATGGIGGLYDATTNPGGNFGQGIMMAARAGAVLADMEFVQFHPTALDTPRYPLALVSEAVRGEGATLINDQGTRFLAHEPGAELAARDVVARAISAEIEKGSQVFLDPREALGSHFAKHFPVIDRLCREGGIDASSQPIPVRPAVHYHMGGVATDLNGRSSVEGLWVAGEAACTGLHGANRLASNSLLEAAIMGMRAAGDIAATAIRSAGVTIANALPASADISPTRPIVSKHLGVLRNAASLEQAIAALLPMAERDGADSDPALVALSIAVFAYLRQESLGAHARTDFPVKPIKPVRREMTLVDVFAMARSIIAQPIARSA